MFDICLAAFDLILITEKNAETIKKRLIQDLSLGSGIFWTF